MNRSIIIAAIIISAAILLNGYLGRTPSATEKQPAVIAPINQKVTVTEPSVVVLGFENLSIPEKEGTELVSALQREITARLMTHTSLKVVDGRTGPVSAQRNPREIGRTFGVAYQLEACVRRTNDQVMVGVQLIDTERGRSVWAERYDRAFGDSTSIGEEITAEIEAFFKNTPKA